MKDISDDLDLRIWDIKDIRELAISNGTNMLMARVTTLTRHRQEKERWVFFNELDMYPAIMFAFCQQHGRVWSTATPEHKNKLWESFKSTEGCEVVDTGM